MMVRESLIRMMKVQTTRNNLEDMIEFFTRILKEKGRKEGGENGSK